MTDLGSAELDRPRCCTMIKVREWSEELTQEVRDNRGNVLRTREDAANYILKLSKDRQNRRSWKAATRALLEGGSASVVTHYIIKALSSDGELG